MISIIIPVYNGGKYIDNILSDLDNQLYKDFEVIFIDDGSKDNSYDCLINAERSEKYNFLIKVIKQNNRGVSAARNTGLDHIKGEYVCFVDVDDGIMPGYLSDMYNVFIREDVDAVVCKTAKDYIEKNSVIDYKTYSKEEILSDFLYRKFTTGVWSMMLKRDLITKNNLKFYEGYKYSEDLHMVWRVFAFCNKAALLNKELYVYKDNIGSAMSKFNNARKDSILLMKDLESFFDERVPSFAEEFKKYGVSRMSWSLLWQAVYHLEWREFKEYIRSYDFKSDLIKLFSYSQKYVAVTSFIFCISPHMYFLFIKSLIKWMNVRFGSSGKE